MKEKFLVYGCDTTFNKRACDILRRDYDVIQLESNLKYNESGSLCLDIHSIDSLVSYISFHDINYFLFSSESLLFTSGKEEYKKIFELIRNIKKESKHVIFIFVAFEEPRVLREFDGISSNKFYKANVEELKLYCQDLNWLIFNYKTYYTHISSHYQIDPLEFEDELTELRKGVHADDIIVQIIQNIKSKDAPLLEIKEHEFSVSRYNGIRRLLYSDFQNDNNLNEYSIESVVAHQKECSIELLYRKNPGERVSNRLVADFRFEMGLNLFRQIPNEVVKKLQYIIPVPETGKYYAQGFASAAKVPYIEALYKRKDIGRSFDIADTQSRNLFLNKKLGIYPDLVANKTVGIIDEAIFTGSTLKVVIHLLKSANVKEIYIFIPSPVCKSQCSYNMQPQRSMLSSYVSFENIAGYLNVEGVYFQNYKIFQNSMIQSGHACIKCFK